jgi:hypothetical protein
MKNRVVWWVFILIPIILSACQNSNRLGFN